MKSKKLQLTLFTTLLLLWPILAFAHGISEGDQQAMLDGGYLRYIWLGASHMLTGYDHLLFILGIIFFLTGFRDILKYITAFTLGHSLTLIFATIYGISANYFLIDAIIALSVCYKGFDNLDGFNKYLGRPSPNLVLVIFGFGLIHGFGLSTRLQQLPLGEDGLIGRILSFNVGVELGQVLALAIMLAIIAGWRRTRLFDRFAALSNRGLVAAGLLLFLVQIHGFGHSVNLNLLGFEQRVQALTTSAGEEISTHLGKALADYDAAFAGRDIMALWNLFSDDIVLYEQGSQNVGKEEALIKHLGPDLQAFQQMVAEFTDVRVLEMAGSALRTRNFTVKGKLPNRYFLAQGLETQNWILEDGQWKLAHMHWSFPGR